MKIIIVPDSFKGGAEAKKVCEICESVLRREIPDAEAWLNLADALSGNDEAGYTDGYAVFDGIAGKMMQSLFS